MPDFKRIVRQNLSLPALKHRREEKILEEIAGQLRDFYLEACARGMSEESALAWTLGQVGDWDAFASRIAGAEGPNFPSPAAARSEELEVSLRHRGRAGAFLADFRQDVRYALRTLRANPAFLLAAVLTLALGIGAGTAIFSVAETILLRPLPFAEPDRLIFLLESKLPQLPEFTVAPGNFLEWQAQNGTFESMAAYAGRSFDLTGAGEPERFRGERVTANLFDVLGLRPVAGRSFLPEEDVPGGSPVVILSHGLWQRRFGGDPAAVGSVISLNGIGYTVVGVMPETAQFLRADTALWVPMAFTGQERQQYGSHFLRAVGRLRPGIALDEARADLETISRRLEAEHPAEDKGWRAVATPLASIFVRNVKPALLLLLGAAGLVLLVACANVANLFLARATGRQKELAVRAALGAGRARLVRQLLTESLVVAMTGGAVGLLSAHWLLRAFLAFAPTALPRTADIGLHAPAVAFALALSALTPLLSGLLPSIQASRTGLNDTLNAGGRTGRAGLRHRTRRTLIVTEVALAAILLVGSGLLVRSYLLLQRVNPGFIASHAVTGTLALPSARYPEEADAYRFYRRLTGQIAQIAGVRAAGATAGMPFSDDFVAGIKIDGRPPVLQSEAPTANYYSVSPGYFEAMGIRLIRGRLFTEQDDPGSPRVAVINETFARSLFPGEEPLGKRVDPGMGPDGWREVIGIVADTKQYGLTQGDSSQIYEPYSQLTFPNMTLVVRTETDPGAVVPALRATVRALDPDLPISRIRTLEDMLEQSIAQERFSMYLLGAFAFSALFLAAIGLYGVLAYAVGQRKFEIGVRIAHGARPADVLWLFVREGLELAVAGAAIGIAAALLLSHMMASMLFGVAPGDPKTLVTVPVAVVTAAVLASLIPAYRAARVDPVATLKGE